MKHEWKPGDVGLIPFSGRVEVGIYIAGGWVTRDTLKPLPFEDIRPLVVIDPEDSRGIAVEIAQRVGSALHIMPGRDISAGIEAVQAALREFANPKPPKPEEPTGLGAVVEGDDKTNWVRAFASPRAWTNGVERLPYADIAAVRVLSEGVQA